MKIVLSWLVKVPGLTGEMTPVEKTSTDCTYLLSHDKVYCLHNQSSPPRRSGHTKHATQTCKTDALIAPLKSVVRLAPIRILLQATGKGCVTAFNETSHETQHSQYTSTSTLETCTTARLMMQFQLQSTNQQHCMKLRSEAFTSHPTSSWSKHIPLMGQTGIPLAVSSTRSLQDSSQTCSRPHCSQM